MPTIEENRRQKDYLDEIEGRLNAGKNNQAGGSKVLRPTGGRPQQADKGAGDIQTKTSRDVFLQGDDRKQLKSDSYAF